MRQCGSNILRDEYALCAANRQQVECKTSLDRFHIIATISYCHTIALFGQLFTVDNCVGEKELAVTVEFIEKRFAQSVVSFQTKAHKTQRSRKDDFKTIV
jgi:hypothetical protein